MDQLKDIYIQRFRGINSLQVEDLRRINVFLGNNNCGKSSLLEAILILLGAAKPTLPIEMNFNRNYYNYKKKDIALFFHNLDVDAPININGSFINNWRRELSISYRQQIKPINIPVEELHDKDLNSEPDYTYGLDFRYKDNGEEYSSNMELSTGSQGKIVSHRAKKVSPFNRYVTAYVAPRYNYESFIKSFNKIITDKEKENILKVLRHIEPKIKDIVLVDNVVMVDIGLEKFVPINVMGDGTRKLFTIVLAMYHTKGGILLIDEIDNGLYYKSTRMLWNALLNISDELGVQLFVSTHNQDSLLALSSVLADKLPEMRDCVKLFTLRRYAEDDVVAYPYDYETFSHLLNSFIEIR